MATLSAMSHRFKDLSGDGRQDFLSPIKKARVRQSVAMSESDPISSSGDEEMELEEERHPSSEHCVIRPTKLVFDSPEKQQESWDESTTKKPIINVMFCPEDDDPKCRRHMTPSPPQSNSTPINKLNSSYRSRMKNSLGEFPYTPKCSKYAQFANYSHLHNSSHLHISRDSSKVLISNIFSPEGMCLESAKRQYHIKRQRQLLRSFDNVDTKSPSTTARVVSEDDTNEDHHPVFDLKSISSSSMEHSRYVTEFHEEELLGSGDFGEVYKCLKFIDGMTYAVKRTRRIVISTVQEKMFRKEIHAHALLARAPHIVNYFSSWADQGFLYLQLEYCNGGTLEDIIQEKYTFSTMALKRLLFQMCEGLRCMHNMRMIHMDIKPANILIVKPHAMLEQPVDTEQLHYKIGDFGHVVADNDIEVEEGDCRYLPKELLLINNNYDSLTKVDVFCLGLTIYEASGVTPLPKNGSLWHRIRDGYIEKLPNLDDDLYKLIKLMIDKDPTKRPSADEIIKMRSSAFCNCICCTQMDISSMRDFDFKSDHIQKYIEERTVLVPNYFHP